MLPLADKNEKAIFDADNLTRVFINEENQIGIEF